MLYNALAATAVGLALGMAPGDTAAALKRFRPIHRRSQVETLSSGVNLINDCYNANPGSMAMALATLMELRDHGRAVAALGDMLELGLGAAADHRALGRLAARLGLDLFVLTVTSGRRWPTGPPKPVWPRTTSSGGVPGRWRPDLTRTPGARRLAPGQRLPQHAHGRPHRPVGGVLQVGAMGVGTIHHQASVNYGGQCPP